MACDCIELVDAQLAPEHHLQATMPIRSGEVSRPIIGIIRNDRYVLETRRGKRASMLCTYCPFCGQKYEDAARGTGAEGGA